MNRPLDRWLLFAAWATLIGIVAAILYQGDHVGTGGVRPL